MIWEAVSMFVYLVYTRWVLRLQQSAAFSVLLMTITTTKKRMQKIIRKWTKKTRTAFVIRRGWWRWLTRICGGESKQMWEITDQHWLATKGVMSTTRNHNNHGAKNKAGNSLKSSWESTGEGTVSEQGTKSAAYTSRPRLITRTIPTICHYTPMNTTPYHTEQHKQKSPST